MPKGPRKSDLSSSPHSTAAFEDRGTTFPFPSDSSGNGISDRLRWLFYDPKVKALYQEHCVYLPAMLGWFLFSSLLSTYNKLVFGKEHMDFPCPLLLTSMHFGAQWIFSVGMCRLFPITFGSERVDNMTWTEWLGVSLPCGLVTSGDVGLSNLSLVTISITFYTMVKASTPVFVLTWGYFFGIIRITWALFGVVLVIALGEFLTVAGEVDFVLKGFLLCLMASILSGARWTLVQLKIQRLEPPLKTTVATMRVLAPFMFLTMIIVSCIMERPWIALKDYIESYKTVLYILALGLGGACLAISMILCEFYLIMWSNAVVLMIGGVIKEILTIFIGVSFFGDTLNAMNFMGCCVVFAGVILYKIVHHLEKEAATEKEAVAAFAMIKDQDHSDNDDRDPHDLNGKPERQPLKMEKPSSGLDLSKYLDEDSSSGRWNDQSGIEMRHGLPLRSRSTESDGIGDHKMTII